MRLIFFGLLFYLGLQPVFAQDPLAEKMKWYNSSKPTTNLFVHFDKNVYANNETIWFTGYLIKTALTNINKHEIMSVALVRDIDSAIIIQDKFLMQNGVSFGNLIVPDSLLTGNYHLLAYTNIVVKNRPEVMFTQAITIKTNIDLKFRANVKMLESTANEHKVLVSVTSKDGLFMPKPTAISYKYGNSYKTASTDGLGQVLISVPQKNDMVDPNIYVKLKYEKDSTYITLPLPQKKAKASVKFYPEGGNMVVGLPTIIGWEVKDQQKMPIPLKAFLYKNNQVIDTIETSSYGIGKFNLNPEPNANYSLKLLHSGLADSTYNLPKAIDQGLILTIANAIATDTLRLNLKTNSSRKLFLRVHNFKESFIYIPFDMEYHKRSVKVALDDVPKGLATITITDSLGRPLAERMFFAHYDNSEKIQLTTDQASYQPRSKVTLKINLNTPEDQGIVSIACVQDNRFEVKKMTDILSYTYLNNELSSLPINFAGNAFKDETYLEQILLVKGWRRYTWQDLQQAKVTDTLVKFDSLQLIGKVTKLNKEITNPLVIGSLGNNKFNLINTDTKGNFGLTLDDIIIPSGKKMFAFVNGESKLTYVTKITIQDPYQGLTAQLAKSLNNEEIIIPSAIPNNTELTLKNNEKSIRLKEIVVNKKNDNSFNYGRGANACGDYVCSYNILNCVNHYGDIGNRQPIAGRSYLTKGVMTVYPGCDIPNPNMFFPVNGVHIHKEFYLNDYKDPQEPAFFSTVYWNYGTILNGNKPTELSFYTSDITGKFRVVVQGVTRKDLVYAEKFFDVKPK